MTLPNDTDCAEGAGSYDIYNLTGSSPGIALSGEAETLTIDAPGRTIKLYTNRVILSGFNARIKVTQGTTLVIYAHEEVRMSNTSTFMGVVDSTGTPDDTASPDQVQIYQYSNGEVVFNGGTTSSAFVFAPFSQFFLAHYVPTGYSELSGTVWVKSIVLDDNTKFIARDMNCANIPSGLCSGGGGGGNRIGSITSWEVDKR